MVNSVGIDFGSSKFIVVADSGDAVLNDIGSISEPTLLTFHERTRLIGDEAAPHTSSENTIERLNELLGSSLDDISGKDFMQHSKMRLNSHTNGVVYASVCHCGVEEEFAVPSLFAVLLHRIVQRVHCCYSKDTNIALCLRPEPSVQRAVEDACGVAGIQADRVSLHDPEDCLLAAYQRKLSALRHAELAPLDGRRVLLVEMGHHQCSVIVAQVALEDGSIIVTKVVSERNAKLGAYQFDLALYSHFVTLCASRYNTEVLTRTKQSARILSACERIRKLLSQLPEASVTVENLTDSGDVTFSLRREDFAAICAPQLDAFAALLKSVLGASIEVAAIEVCGGGARMQVVQQAIQEVIGGGLSLGAKLDDGSFALGAAVLRNRASTSPPLSCGDNAKTDCAVGMSEEEVSAAAVREAQLRGIDAEVKLVHAERNAMESFILELRAAPRQKHGDKIDSDALNAALDEFETWLWESALHADLATLKQKGDALRRGVEEICREYRGAIEAEKRAKEEALDREAAQAAAERAAEGCEEDDHDTRKLKKADRMRLVMKNKEEGNDLFKGGNFRPAAARYHKALTHSTKFFDLSPDDSKEVQLVQVSLYLNLAQCYLKLENWEQAIRYASDVLKIDANNSKALFRRAAAYEAKKELEKAMADLKRSDELSGGDALIKKATERVKRQIQKEKEKEKKMWGKAFA